MSKYLTGAWLWVVEMRVYGRWEATMGAGLTKGSGSEELKEWRKRNPSDTFRLTRYVRPRTQAPR